jgi:glycosyltransferase involved in cell wall biosynthesis
MKISFIIICRNAEKYIERCINSILSLEIINSEIIVVDGNSEDKTIELLMNKFSVNIYTQSGIGIGNARNVGLMAASGEIICYLDSDDFYVKESFLTLIAYLENNKKVMAVGGNLIKSNEMAAKSYPAYTPGGFAFRKKVFDKIGLFREDLEAASDHEWFMRFIRTEKAYEMMQDVVLIKEIHEENLSIVKSKQYRNEMMRLFKSKI